MIQFEEVEDLFNFLESAGVDSDNIEKVKNAFENQSGESEESSEEPGLIKTLVDMFGKD